VPQTLDGHLPGDGDGGRVQRLADARPDEGGADDDLTVPVDEDPCPASVVGPVLDGAREVTDLVVDDLDGPAGALGSRTVRPTEETSGSVNTTPGTRA
jgi:hypothetical protein